MFRKLTAILNSDKVTLALAGLCITSGITLLGRLTEARTEYIGTLDRAIENRRKWLAEADAQWQAAYDRNLRADVPVDDLAAEMLQKPAREE